MILTSTFVLFALFAFGCNGMDYCNKTLCPNGGTHIGCHQKNTFAASCDSPHLVDFDKKLQKLVVDGHNKFRNNLASGATNFLSASRMRILNWNAELAKLAEYNVRQCALKHDDCRNTGEFPICGQNLGLSVVNLSTGLNADDIAILIDRIQNNWYNETQFAYQVWFDMYTPNTYGHVIFHLMTMMQDRCTDIGCSAATYQMLVSGKKQTTILLACNYSFTNIINHPVYVSGPPASKCKTGHHHYYTSLCSPLENINGQILRFTEHIKGSHCKKKAHHIKSQVLV